MTKPNKDDDERVAWLLDILTDAGEPHYKPAADALRRRDLRERKRGMALAALALLTHGPCRRKPYSCPTCLHGHVLAKKAGPAAMAWARKQQEAEK